MSGTIQERLRELTNSERGLHIESDHKMLLSAADHIDILEAEVKSNDMYIAGLHNEIYDLRNDLDVMIELANNPD